MILILSSCKKEKKLDLFDGSWELIMYKMEFFDENNATLHEELPPFLYGFRNTSITGQNFKIENDQEFKRIDLRVEINTPNAVFESYSVEQKGASVVLNWTTSYEKNNPSFRISKRGDGGTWVNIGYVDGQGDSNTLRSYSFVDKEYPMQETYVYNVTPIHYMYGFDIPFITGIKYNLQIEKEGDKYYLIFPGLVFGMFDRLEMTKNGRENELLLNAAVKEADYYKDATFKKASSAKLEIKLRKR